MNYSLFRRIFMFLEKWYSKVLNDENKPTKCIFYAVDIGSVSIGGKTANLMNLWHQEMTNLQFHVQNNWNC